MVRVNAFPLLLAFFSLLSLFCKADEYDQKCEEIESLASIAGQLYNRGKTAEALAKLEESEASFKAARDLNPKEPQAYVSIATAMLNAQRFDKSIRYWNEAGSLVQAGSVRDWTAAQAKWAKYGKISVLRDKVYASGQGNLTRALKLMERQLAIYPTFPTLHFDKARALVMLSNVRDGAVGEALRSFEESTLTTFEAWRAGQRAASTVDAHCCGTCGGVVLDWSGHLTKRTQPDALQAVEWFRLSGDGERYGGVDDKKYRDGNAFVARFSNVAIAGDDGFILDEQGCWMFLPSSARWSSGPANVQMLEVWRGPTSPQPSGAPHAWHDHNRGRLTNTGRTGAVRRVNKLASVVQFASVSFFHFVTEVIGRLLILRSAGIFDDPEMKLLAPQIAGKNNFPAQVMDLLAKDLIDADRVIWWNAISGPADVRLRVKTLNFADWLSPAELGEDGSHCATPRSVLNLVWSSMLGGVSTKLPDSTALRSLIWMSRWGEAMRSELVGESELTRALAEVAKEALPQLEFITFRSANGGLVKEINVFQQARVVVGVHGGGFTNLLFAPTDTIAFELGFTSPFAGHYRHLAAAMGLKLVTINLSTDVRGMGVRKIEVNAGTQDVIDVVREHLAMGLTKHPEL